MSTSAHHGILQITTYMASRQIPNKEEGAGKTRLTGPSKCVRDPRTLQAYLALVVARAFLAGTGSVALEAFLPLLFAATPAAESLK